MVRGFWGHRCSVCRPVNAPRPGGKETRVARREHTGSITLAVRITFEPTWGSPTCVAQAYERVVPITRRPPHGLTLPSRPNAHCGRNS